MRKPMRTPTLALLTMGLLCLVPTALAQELPDVGTLPALPGEHHADASAATDKASGALGAETGHADPAHAADEGFWAWIGLRFNLLFQGLAGLLGVETPADGALQGVDGALDVDAGLDGADVAAHVGDVSAKGDATLDAPETEVPDAHLPAPCHGLGASTLRVPCVG